MVISMIFVLGIHAVGCIDTSKQRLRDVRHSIHGMWHIGIDHHHYCSVDNHKEAHQIQREAAFLESTRSWIIQGYREDENDGLYESGDSVHGRITSLSRESEQSHSSRSSTSSWSEEPVFHNMDISTGEQSSCSVIINLLRNINLPSCLVLVLRER